MKVIAQTRLAKAQRAMGVAKSYGAANEGPFSPALSLFQPYTLPPLNLVPPSPSTLLPLLLLHMFFLGALDCVI